MRQLGLMSLAALMMLVAHADDAVLPAVLPNGDIEQADPARAGKAAHWDLMDGLGVQWTNAPGSGHGKAIRMDTAQTEKAMVTSYAKAGLTQWVFPKPADTTIAETYGLSLYSEAMPVVAGKTYRVTFDYLAEKGTGGKLWFRAYANVNGEKKRVYEGTIDCGGSGGWKQFSGVFHPTKYRPKVDEVKIMLFA